MNISETELGWIGGCLFLLCLLIAYPSIVTGIALIRWHLRAALDRSWRR